MGKMVMENPDYSSIAGKHPVQEQSQRVLKACTLLVIPRWCRSKLNYNNYIRGIFL